MNVATIVKALSALQNYVNGTAAVSLPQNAYGIRSAMEQGAGTVVYNFSNGLNGVTISNFSTAANAGGIIFVAFNNDALSDATLNGFRYAIGPNTSLPIPFEGSPRPTQMTIVVPATAGVSAFYVAAEASL